MSKEPKFKVSIKPYNPLNDDMVTHIIIKTKFVSEGIGENYKFWTPQNPVLISAQTGMGKNTFIENSIIKHATETYGKVLIISNRTACNRQQKERIAYLTRCEYVLEDLSFKGLDKKEEFNNIRIVTYQKLEKYLDNIFELEKLKHFDVVVFDECHFFLSDALFNNKTGKILAKSLLSFKNQIRIYMTATPDYIFPIIAEKEKNSGNSTVFNCMNFNDFSYCRPKEILYYDFQRNYKYVFPKYFENKSEILELIKNDKSANKWLVFVSNKQDGELFINEIGSNSIFIDATSKNSTNADGKIYEEIITQEKYSCKVLVCTSVLDNGINFKDDSLINIVIFSSDKTEFIQMLGRKRLSDEEKITLYICARTALYFNQKLFTLNKQLQAINCFKNNSSVFLNQYYTGVTSDWELVRKMFYFDSHSNPVFNSLVEKKLSSNKDFFERMIDKLNSGTTDAFIIEQLSWLGLQKTYNPRSWVSYVDSNVNKATLIKFLDEHCDIPLSGDSLDNFEKEFKTQVCNAYGKQNGDRTDRPNYKATKMRKFFEANNLSYAISIEKNIFTLRKC